LPSKKEGEILKYTVPTEPIVSENARIVLEERYLLKNADGEIIETPAEMDERIAKALSLSERNKDIRAKWYHKFLWMLRNRYALPNSPMLMNAGTPLNQLFACYVLPIEDSMESIFGTLKNAALVHKAGGGTGFSFGRLRAKNAYIQTTGGQSSGPLSFLKAYDAATATVVQGSKRRGANLAMLPVSHPDIFDFIELKEKDGDISNFNISVACTDEFMDAVEHDALFDIEDPKYGVVRSVKARDIMSKIVYQAWKNGEPGICFIDRVNETNPTPDEEIVSCNPCGETYLLDNEACDLGSINLSLMFKEDRVDWKLLKEVIHVLVRMLDNAIDISNYPLPEIEEKTKQTRKIGIGVMGLAEALYKVNLSYNSREGIAFAEEISSFIQTEAQKASMCLAEEKGVFPEFESSIYYPDKRMRNATVTVQAPTGSLSIIANTSAGIEPLYKLVYERNILKGKKFIEINSVFEFIARERGVWSNALVEALILHGSIQKVQDLNIPEDFKRLFVCAHDIAPEWHVNMQAAIQEHVCNAVSKTVNMSFEATEKDVYNIILSAYRKGCKGVTVYRDGSRTGQPMASLSKKKPLGVKRERPVVLYGPTYKIKTSLGSLLVTLNSDEVGLRECLIQVAKAGSDITADAEALGRLISNMLAHGLSEDIIMKQLSGISSTPIFWESRLIKSIPDAIAHAFMIYKEVDKKEVRQEGSASGNLCPMCGHSLIYQEGCMACINCKGKVGCG